MKKTTQIFIFLLNGFVAVPVFFGLMALLYPIVIISNKGYWELVAFWLNQGSVSSLYRVSIMMCPVFGMLVLSGRNILTGKS